MCLICWAANGGATVGVCHLLQNPQALSSLSSPPPRPGGSGQVLYIHSHHFLSHPPPLSQVCSPDQCGLLLGPHECPPLSGRVWGEIGSLSLSCSRWPVRDSSRCVFAGLKLCVAVSFVQGLTNKECMLCVLTAFEILSGQGIKPPGCSV